MTENVKKLLLGLVAKGDLRKAIDELQKVDLNPGMKTEALAIAARYRRLQSGKLKGIFMFHEDTITENQIMASLIDLLHFPDDQVFPEERSIDQKVPVRVLYWKYVTYVAIVVGLLAGGTTLVLNLDKLFGMPPIAPSNTVTVVVHGEKIDQPILPNRGVVVMEFNGTKEVEQTNIKGEAVFKEVPENIFDQKNTVKIYFSDPLNEPYFAVKEDSTYHLKKDQLVRLQVKLFGLDSLHGITRDFVTGDPIDSVRVSTQGLETYSNAFGEFYLKIPPDRQLQFVTIRAQKAGYEFYEAQDVPPQTGGEVAIVMKRKKG